MYQWRKGIAQWKVDGTLYISVPFTWLMRDAEYMASKHKGKTLIGGPGTMKPTHCEGFEPLLFHNPAATFTTRGCPNRCKFCAVPILEGDFVEIEDFRPAPVICDNNFLASSERHMRRVIGAVQQYRIVDFNQGLDARLFNANKADILAKANCHIRFSFDHVGMETVVHDAIKLALKITKKVSCYVLFGYNDTPDDAQYRLELVRSWGAMPNPMRYQPLNATGKNDYVADGWTERQMLDIMRYYSRLLWFGKLSFAEYNNRIENAELEF